MASAEQLLPPSRKAKPRCVFGYWRLGTLGDIRGGSDANHVSVHVNVTCKDFVHVHVADHVIAHVMLTLRCFIFDVLIECRAFGSVWHGMVGYGTVG